MITAIVDTLAPSPSGLVVGFVVHGPDDAWVRFVAAEIPWRLITPELIASCTNALDRDVLADQQQLTLPYTA